MDPIKLRMRYLIGFFVAAVLTAAVLRHFLHVQVGLTREEIRSGVPITASIAIFFTAIFSDGGVVCESFFRAN